MKNSTLATLLPADKLFSVIVAEPLFTDPLKTLVPTVILTVPFALLLTLIVAVALAGKVTSLISTVIVGVTLETVNLMLSKVDLL